MIKQKYKRYAFTCLLQDEEGHFCEWRTTRRWKWMLNRDIHRHNEIAWWHTDEPVTYFDVTEPFHKRIAALLPPEGT